MYLLKPLILGEYSYMFISILYPQLEFTSQNKTVIQETKPRY